MSQILKLTIVDDSDLGKMCAVGTMDVVKRSGSRERRFMWVVDRDIVSDEVKSDVLSPSVMMYSIFSRWCCW